MLFQSVVLAIFFSIIPAASLQAASPHEALKEAQTIVGAGEWVVLDVQHPRILGSLGRVQALVERGKERKLLKFSQTGDAPTLTKGDVVTFTLSPLLEGRGVEGLPAVETPWGGKAPSLHPFEVGSYLIPHRKR